MDAAEIVVKIRAATVEPYQLGLTFAEPMVAPMPERSTYVDAGPVRFVVEVRRQAVLTDFGGTVHVFGVDDGLEHLRFDCFEAKPHYHYVHHPAGSQTTCRFDQYANGDPIEWTVRCLRTQLPAMLEHAGSFEPRRRVAEQVLVVAAAAEEVEGLLRAASDRARAEWATA